jgi:hypothetical protein
MVMPNREHGSHWKTALLALSLATLAGCGLCGDEDKVDVVSPGGAYVASAFHRNCGATTPYVTHVQLRLNRRWLSGRTSLFVERGWFAVGLKWESSERLVVTCADCPALPRPQAWDDVTVRFQHEDRGSIDKPGEAGASEGRVRR